MEISVSNLPGAKASASMLITKKASFGFPWQRVLACRIAAGDVVDAAVVRAGAIDDILCHRTVAAAQVEHAIGRPQAGDFEQLTKLSHIREAMLREVAVTLRANCNRSLPSRQ